ncbi:MAG: alcohol dehydrogenase catalytic domain-containing protein [Phycisphaerae bacterium]|nr:alcohol dehydrogenase catalytic domain-containing protein [Phycisphaerae bacterium]
MTSSMGGSNRVDSLYKVQNYLLQKKKEWKKMNGIPEKQTAVQLIGPDKLMLNSAKPVDKPGPYQILARVEAVGLCFSDLKLLKQFDKHARKSEIIAGIDPAVLTDIPSYRPGTEPTVPGHEAFCTIAAVGRKVRRHWVGQRVLVQTDYRWLKTAESNSAFGYNFEGALQQYVLMDERIIVDPQTGESFLIPVEKDLSASAIALVEPWACVESSYATEERNAVLAAGKLLVAAEAGRKIEGLLESFLPQGRPAAITAVCADESQYELLKGLGVKLTRANAVSLLPDEAFDDIVYFGSSPATIEILNDKLAARGIINIVLAGRPIGQDVSVGVGRIHYGLTRWIGTTGANAAESYKHIPSVGEVRRGDRVLIAGAAGPMGQMHTIRLICSGIENLSITGTDFDDQRLEELAHKSAPLAQQRSVHLELVNPNKQPPQGKFSYFAIMAPAGALVAQAIRDSTEGTLINVFAGIPASVRQGVDLDTYIANRCFIFGTSGSRLSDMKAVLQKVLSGQLDTNSSVGAVSGLAGAIEGMRAVENRTIAGKILVYPALEAMPLITLPQLEQVYPSVARKLDNGIWTKSAEEELFRVGRKV